MFDRNVLLTWVIFAVTYFGLALGKFPGLRIDRAGIAWVGAAAMMAFGLVNFDEAIQAIDFATLALLLGMMAVVAFLHRAGFFEILAGWALGRFRKPKALLATTMGLSGFLSALLVNDVVCLALTPLVLQLTRQLRIDPKPQLIGLAIASNVGSTATLTGNPQNMIIGGLSHISYLHFAAKLAPIAILSLIAAYGILLLVYRNSLSSGAETTEDKKENTPSKPMHFARRFLLIKSLSVTVSAVVLFFAGVSMSIVALSAAAVLFLGRIKPKKIYDRIDWSLLLLFAGLFVVVHVFDIRILSHAGVENWKFLRDYPISFLSAISALLSNLVSNVPAVLLFKPIIPTLPSEMQETAWLALAMSSTLAGNLTILGSIANLIVVEIARKEGISISILEYCRAGVPVTILSIFIGIGWLNLVHH
ncbi:anion transporter [Telmatocola sphagniphila]|uniref:Anion transporter n=1 Tax=Telmatocola sphagniphila TaxID=1123043 RepID=A0A8E6BBP2_9BACT|nr:anion transporter [Telmatocola sphagniphila]QVL33935.1 anion transporter [Telmatocola sphagniphila]